jgi:hypothetical protein
VKQVLDDLIGQQEIGPEKAFSSRLVACFSTPPYQTISKVDFISRYAKIVALSIAYGALFGGPLRLVDDTFFEEAALGLLAKGGTIYIGRLEATAEAAGPRTAVNLNRKGSSVVVALNQRNFVDEVRKLRDLASIGSEPTPLLVPGVRNQPAVDAADARDRFYQITRADSHGITYGGIAPLYTDPDGRKRKIKLIFIVHPESKLDKAQRFIGCSPSQLEEAGLYVEQYVARGACL